MYYYIVALKGRGADVLVSRIPENIRKYIKDQCNNDGQIYREKLERGEIPEEYKLADSMDKIWQSPRLVRDGEIIDEEIDYSYHIWQKQSVYSDGIYEVYDEHRNLICKGNISELHLGTDLCIPDDIDVGYDEYYVWREEKEYVEWFAEIETDKPFDKSKLTVDYQQLLYCAWEYEVSLVGLRDGERIGAITYDENDILLLDGNLEPVSSRTLEFFISDEEDE